MFAGTPGCSVCKALLVASAIWLVVWLIKGTPNLDWFGDWNDWSVALLGCAIFDVFGGGHVARSRATGNPQEDGG